MEGFGLVCLEVTNYAKPCVGCFFDDGAADVIVHVEAGHLVQNPNDAQQVLGVLCVLPRDPVHARTLGGKVLNASIVVSLRTKFGHASESTFQGCCDSGSTAT